MNIKNNKLIFVTTLLFSISILGILPTLARSYLPDEWVVASDYDITSGDYYYGTLSDTYTDNNVYLIGDCFWTWYPYHANEFKILFDFYNSHYKQVVIDASTDILGSDGKFYLVAYYTTGNPVDLGQFSPGTKKYYNLDQTRVLDKIGLEYRQVGTPWQRTVYIDQINALWTDY